MKRWVWQAGWWAAARPVESPNCDARPANERVDLVVLHSISLPPGQYGSEDVEHLFTNRLDHAKHPYFESLRGLRVSAHFFIRRDGSVLQFVSCEQRAWHAGASTWRGRERCNDRSVGIEMEGLEGEQFDDAQYDAVARLLQALRRRYPIADVVGHEHIAPGRKADPGAGFDWRRLGKRLQWPTQDATPLSSRRAIRTSPDEVRYR